MIALNVLYTKIEKIYRAYVLEHNSKCKKQIIFAMISKGEGCHYVAVKELPAILRRVTSK